MTAPAATSPALFPLGDGIGSVALVDHLGSDKRVVDAARVSLAGDGQPWREDADPKLIRYLLKAGHWSPFEHPQATLRVTCPLFVRSQWMRHRHSFNEVSGRYTEVQDRLYVPAAFRKQAPSNRQASVEDDGTLSQDLARRVWEVGNRHAFAAYENLLDLGVTREQARGVLPQCAYTDFYVTANLRSWLHFIQVRDHSGAQFEMVLYARAVQELLAPLFPVTFREWRALHP